MNKLNTAFLLLLGCQLVTCPALWAQGMTIQDSRMSADLNGVSLMNVAEDIYSQLGISFRADDSLMQRRVSVAFKDLPIEQAIKRILAGTSYILLFDSQGRVSQVMVMSKEKEPMASQDQFTRSQARPSPTPLVPTQRTVPSQPAPEQQPLAATGDLSAESPEP
jgi:type II secretory pathway component GspD/PulD (secretin)